MKEIAKRIINRFNCRRNFFRVIPESARVLELGCGTGDNGKSLKVLRPLIELHGVDIEPENNESDFYLYKQLLDLDNGILPFPDEYFEAIIFTHVIEHLSKPLQLGKEINRVMKKGGKIYVEAPNWTTILVPSFGFHREQHGPFNFYDDPSHIKPWTKHGLFAFLLQSCNLTSIKVGNTRNWLRIPLDFVYITYGLLTSNRKYIMSSFWNLYGWCIYGIGTKE